MRSRHRTGPRGAQRGVALVIGLLFLLVMSLVGVEVSRSSLLDQRMAGNAAVKGLSFERAEHARRVAEQRLDALVAELDGGGGVDCAVLDAGFYARAGLVVGCPVLDARTLLWSETDSADAGAEPGERYVVEYLGEDALFVPGTGIEIGSGESEALPVHVFRVVARGSQDGGAATTIETRFAIGGS